MKFKEAFEEMKSGIPVKLPSWAGYWWWDEESQTILMYTKDGDCLDIRETQNVEYTLQNILSDEWVYADSRNCPILGGEATFSFGEAIKYLKRGMKVARKGLKRILSKTPEPYTADKIYATLCKDPADSTPNQVGDYTDRQKAVISMIKNYAVTAERKEDAAMTKTEKAIRQMETWAKDDSHGYDQDYRWGEKGDYDCSSAVIQAWQNAGVPVKSGGATYTGDMKNVFLKNGFVDVTSKVNVATGSGLLRGDVLLNEAHHVAMYCGNGKEVEASINEKGTAHGGKPGDQTGKEFLIRSYRNYPWNCVLRYRGNIFSVSDTEKKQNAVAYVARFTKDCKCYSAAGKTQAKMFPVIKKNAVVDVMKYTETVNGKKWYFIRIPHPTEGFVREFVPAGYFKKLI